MTAGEVFAVTGASGQVGGRVARRLAEHGVAARLVVRDRARAPRLSGAEVRQAEYADGASMRAALDGATTVFLTSAAESANRVAEHDAAVDAAAAAGVRRIVYLSFLGAAPEATFTFARDHWHTEQRIRASGLAWTFLRDSIYLDFLPPMVGADGVLRGPAGDGKVAAVARDDAADVAAAVLRSRQHDGRTLDVTGPEALSMAAVAEQISQVSGRAARYQEESLEEAYASRAAYGQPRWVLDGWVTTYTAVARGELALVSDTVARVAGHPPLTLIDFLRAHPESYAHLPTTV